MTRENRPPIDPTDSAAIAGDDHREPTTLPVTTENRPRGYDHREPTPLPVDPAARVSENRPRCP